MPPRLQERGRGGGTRALLWLPSPRDWVFVESAPSGRRQDLHTGQHHNGVQKRGLRMSSL